ncbi:MAG TPA: TusE/DsrC/DsvC family sulfur relay protein [Gammaproteobacteria bacterium]|nr:TusE/DsrC/DsvC family sulfur relay protein [Gammaproteobacteria bacterium]
MTESESPDFVAHSETARIGAEPEAYDLDEWSEEIAARLAEEEGIELTDEHLAILRFVREQYQAQGPMPAREMIAMLVEEYAPQGGKKYLYRLFPKGPVCQASKLAGLPVPPDAIDKSFGSVM